MPTQDPRTQCAGGAEEHGGGWPWAVCVGRGVSPVSRAREIQCWPDPEAPALWGPPSVLRMGTCRAAARTRQSELSRGSGGDSGWGFRLIGREETQGRPRSVRLCQTKRCRQPSYPPGCNAHGVDQSGLAGLGLGGLPWQGGERRLAGSGGSLDHQAPSWPLTTYLHSSKRGKICGGKKPIDAQALRKKVSSVTCDPAARAILSSLLLYITDLQDRPPGPPPTRGSERRESRVSRAQDTQDAHRRPTCFQLLQAKFMGTGREPRLKKTREVGRLIFKDKQGPSRILVTATINKLLDKAREGTGRTAQDGEPLCNEKSRRGLPTGGKGTVKNILKIFLAAEEKNVCEKPEAARGPLPKPASKRGSVLSRLRAKFEQSGCLCSEASVLPLRTEGRKKGLRRRKTHRPEARVLCTATMASTCIRTPLARFLACTAEPVLAFNIATVVCSPRSWLSHCAKIGHSDRGHVSSAGDAASRENKTVGWGQPGGHPEQPPAPSATAPGDSLEAGFLGMGPKPVSKPDPASASHRGEALPGCEPRVAPLKPASPWHAGAAREDRMGDPPAGDSAQYTWGPGGARASLWPGPPRAQAGVAPEVALTVCSSEDETEVATPGSERDPLFAVQQTFPEQKVAGRVPPLAVPAVQALRRAQPAAEPPQITVRRPLVHEMPPPAALPKAPGGGDKGSSLRSGGDVGTGRGAGGGGGMNGGGGMGGGGSGDGGRGSEATRAASAGRKGSAGPRQGSLETLSVSPEMGAASVGRDLSAAGRQQSPTRGKENTRSAADRNALCLRHPEGPAGQDAPEPACQKHPSPAAGDGHARGEDAPSHHPTASENQWGGDGHWAPCRGGTKSESAASAHGNGLREQEPGGPPRRGSARSGLRAAGRSSTGLGGDRPTSLSERPKPSTEVPGAAESHTAAAPGSAPSPVNVVAGERKPVREAEGRPPSPHCSPAAEARAPAASHPLGSVPVVSWRHHGLGATGSGACGGLGGTPEARAAALPEAGVPLCTRAEAESEASTGAGGRGATARHGSPCEGDLSTVPGWSHPTTQGSAGVGPPQNQPSKEDKCILPEKQVPPSVEASPAAAEGQRAGQVPPKCPDLQAHLPPASLLRSGVPKGVEDSRGTHQPLAGLGALEERAAGPMRLGGPLEKGVALRGQEPGPCAAEEGQKWPWGVQVGSGPDTGATKMETGQHPKKGLERVQGQQAWRAESPRLGYSAQAGRMVSRSSVGPPKSSSEAVATTDPSRMSQGPGPRGGQGGPGTPHRVGERPWPSGPKPAQGSVVPAPRAPAQEGPSHTPVAGRGAVEHEHHRRLASFAKYRAQSFSDQRSFDLSFRPTTIRASDTFELPK
ncbi:collagen alpha-1(I) chain [Felis catus]|uniref:collagen alpha-1(I) chain n=1 Tax=Felis catus TaxID=9685 RepID=UPI001D1A2011|nr:collagen alpha-1(I) chain [Felis catus]